MSEKLISWNLNGLRAAVKKGFHDSILQLNPDVLCIQETKAQDDQIREALGDIPYHIYSSSAIKRGYSGTAILSKKEPLSINYGLGIDIHDQEGRIITAEFEDYFLTTVYVPNSKNDLSRLEYRQGWDADFKNYLKNLEKTKPVIVCGDFNVAHKDIDLARPKANYNKSAGFTQAEIDGMDNFVAAGLIDSFRHLHPDQLDAYSWWSYRAGAKEKNVGWRIDYFLMSESMLDKLDKAEIHPTYVESDHCPVSITLK
ncbi:exodeoxyribonuclease III [Reichenbachiella agarivorans]|uniref:Exodeoxyribonuclease III n=1 Tax=Reichenbachiella agarivorans TaxID=2979464 RepID=A0ABY6CSE6_9BACT|nr:exodeoxyribonuclease III [Reichenbachiella agarivorans]UXP33408.1 exodeoxyribonuclease III [Reichenbachiella agarivorans]